MKIPEIIPQPVLNCPLFRGITAEEAQTLLHCLLARYAAFARGEILITQGSHPTEAGIVLTGQLEAVKLSYSGNRQVMARLNPADVFGDALISTRNHPSPVTVTAITDATVLFLGCENILGGCCQCCPAHGRLRQNLLSIIAEKFWALNQKLAYLAIHSLRGRIAAYLLDAAGGRTSFSIAYDRAGMADYLGADRSALSRELSRMKAEGLLDYYKNSFKLNLPALERCLADAEV